VNTPSHFLMTALAGDQLKRRNIAVSTSGMLSGSVLPDIPLFVLTFGYFAYRSWFEQFGPDEFIFDQRYDNLYFSNPYWIAAHNLFHAPLVIAMIGLIGYFGMHRKKWWGAFVFWFAVACGFHSVIDIFTHHNDGPVLFFPFEWTYRFPAPISYWHPDYGGRVFAPLELLLDIAIIGFFVVNWWRFRLNKNIKTKV
jgi:hypothetical protein